MNQEVAEPYTSPTQRARVMSERWVADNLGCPACHAGHLQKLSNNRPAADFVCPGCAEQFEVKGGTRFGPSIPDGAYSTLKRRMEADDNPNLVLLKYDQARTTVLDLEIVPRRFFTPSIIEQRPPLPSSARRAGWVGCRIHLDRLPSTGRISVITERRIRPQAEVRAEWARLGSLLDPGIDQRTWLTTVLQLVENMGAGEFSLPDLYRHEIALQSAFPENKNIRAKVRQQLQRLRDAGFLVFLGSGRYRPTTSPSV